MHHLPTELSLKVLYYFNGQNLKAKWGEWPDIDGILKALESNSETTGTSSFVTSFNKKRKMFFVIKTIKLTLCELWISK